MESKTKLSAFSKFAVFTLLYNVVVILWGVFLRASHSGDGCGQHWVTCGGEFIPTAPAFKTTIEFSHRVTTTLAGFIVIGLAVWAVRKYGLRSGTGVSALLSLAFIIVEGLLGRGLVLTGNTAGNWTPTRPYWTAGHLINTFILLMFLTLTVWYSLELNQRAKLVLKKGWIFLAIGVAAIFLVGISGSMAALTNMLFPSETIAEGIAKDFDPDSHYLLRLRILHPIVSIFSAVYLIFICGWFKRQTDDPQTQQWASATSILVLVQVIFGVATLLMLAPIVMQLGHLLLADLVWITFILMGVSYLRSETHT